MSTHKSTANDPEIAAASAVARALERLDPMARVRVLDWARERFVPGGRDPIALVTATIHMLGELAGEIRVHAESNENPSEADRKLYGGSLAKVSEAMAGAKGAEQGAQTEINRMSGVRDQMQAGQQVARRQ